MRSLSLYLAIALGGALGALSRYALSNWIGTRWTTSSFPLGTWVVNLLGAFALGFVFTYALGHELSPIWRTTITSGFIGAFTTFSTLNYEAWVLLSESNWQPALVYLGSSWILGLAAVAAGVAVARALPDVLMVSVTALASLAATLGIARHAPDAARTQPKPGLSPQSQTPLSAKIQQTTQLEPDKTGGGSR